MAVLYVGIEDYWTEIPRTVGLVTHVDMLVGPRHYGHVTGYLNCSGVEYETTIEDLQTAIDEENIPAKSDEDELIGRPGEINIAVT